MQTEPPPIGQTQVPLDPGLSIETRIQNAIKTWTNQLIDVGGRNNLLFYRDLRAGTLDLGNAREPIVESLLAGKPVRISNLFPDPELRKDVLRRVRTIHSKAREHFEEKGISTLYLACGMATWKNPRTTSLPAAPVLLRPAELRTRGAAQDDFELVLAGEMEVNPVLMHILKSDFGREIPQDALLDRLDGVIDTPWELLEAYSWLTNEARVIPGFSVAPRMVVGNFLYAKLPMVRDIEGSAAQLAKHDLIAAIAGDPAARERLRAKHSAVTVLPDEPDMIKPEDEFLVLDADASQNVAINRVLRGQDLIIKGPPGTGKSQTIANLIASLLGRGQKVLFVAEKRAAIDAVFSRLDHAGLSDMLLDIHGGAGARRQTAENLAKALTTMANAPRPTNDGLGAEIVSVRTRLRAHAAAMHVIREPWGISLVDALERASTIPIRAQATIRLKPSDLEKIDGHTYESLVGNLQEFLELGGERLPFSPWADAAIDSAEVARSSFEQLSSTRSETLPSARQALLVAVDETGLPPASRPAEIDTLLAIWRRVRDVLATSGAEIFTADLDRLAADLEPARSPLSRIIALVTSGRYRAARTEAKALAVNTTGTDASLLDLVTLARDIRTDWMKLAPDTPPVPPRALEDLLAIEGQLRNELDHIGRLVGWGDLSEIEIEEVERWLDDLIADRTTLLRLPDLRRTRKALLDAGLEPLLRHVTAAKFTRDDAASVLEWTWVNSIIERVEFTEQALTAFDPERLRGTSKRFGALDRQNLKRAATRVRRLYAENGIQQRDAHPDEAAMITRQAALKRRHMPLRDLFRKAPNALLAVKPCWAMSPLVVSQILPVEEQYFDVVIFDEASQVTPADAIPSIMRGRSVVVAGDDRQLPPTSFFMATQPEDEERDEDADELDMTKGFESVLDSLAAILPTTRLDWHYRSQDERLIAFSNAEFYDGQLITFPGIAGHGSIRHVLVNSTGAADQQDSANAEVHEVVKLILEHAQQSPAESLGVIAMGITHATRIEDALRLAVRGRTDLDEFFDESREERFFVKNLERVQGDERDAIILSVGYGKSPDGRLFYRFGPINLEGGERRLNVAVTRARRRMTVVSSFSAAEMDPARTTRRGARSLREYLAYAEAAASVATLSPTEDGEADDIAPAVREALSARGITSDIRVGSSSQWIDVAVRDPGDSGRYILAVETDGRGYRAVVTTRDRERLRHEQLQRLGWRHHRLWNMEWLRDPSGAVDRIVAKVERAKQGLPDDDPGSLVTPDLVPDDTPSRPGKPLLGQYWKIDDISPNRLAALIDWIESDGVLRTEGELVQEAVRELGFQRRGSRIDAAVRTAISSARRRRKQ